MEQIALTIAEVAKAGLFGRAKLYEEIKKGRLRAYKVGRSTRILPADLRAYVAALPAIDPQGVAPPSDTRVRKRRRRRSSSARG